MPVRTAAILCSGLPDDSRVKVAQSGAKAPFETLLLAAIFDQISIIRWLQTSDAAKGVKRPKQLLPDLLIKQEADTLAFDTGEEFFEAYRKVANKCQH